MKYLFTAAAAVAAVSLAACGGGGGGIAPSGIAPVVVATTTPVSSDRASASITFTIPGGGSRTSSSTTRSPRFISPGTDKISVFVDGAAVFTDANGNPPQNYTSANTNASFACTTGGADAICTLSFDTIPGTHKIGVVIKGGSPAIILSEGENTYALKPGNNTGATLPLLGVHGTGYIMCDTDANIAANNNCQNSFDTTSGKYTLTGVAADFNGFPIPFQLVGGNPLPFDNGTFTVVETGTSTGVVTLSNNGPFNNPGNALTAQPSGGFFAPGTFSYGQHFNVVCNKLGTATLGIHNDQQGPTSGVQGQAYSYFDPSNNFPTQTGGVPDYPGAGTTARGSKFTGNPDYHGGTNPHGISDLVTVSCDANFVLTLI